MKRDYSIAILAGGQSSRMAGGRPKAFAVIGGRPLIMWISDELRPLGREIFVVGGDGQDFLEFELPHFGDVMGKNASAVGIHSALSACRADWCLIVPCDMPFVDRGLVEHMASRINGNTDAIVPMNGSAKQPLFGLYRKGCADVFRQQIEDGRMSIADILAGLDVAWIRKKEMAGLCDPDRVFLNINSVHDLEAARRLLAARIPIVAFAGKKDSGKTTFLEQLIPVLEARGLRIAFVKHDTHGFEMDRRGTDTDRIMRAGAEAVAISSPDGMALLHRTTQEKNLTEIRLLMDETIDLIVAEGFKSAAVDRIEVSRSARSSELACSEADLIAVISDRPEAAASLPVFGMEAVDDVAAFIIGRYGLDKPDGRASTLRRS
jgi:molybdopterin-guanine dinucleotide biosynthesis protein MobB